MFHWAGFCHRVSLTAVAELGSVPGSEAMGHFVIARNPLSFVLQ